jgi:hypothetical protein
MLVYLFSSILNECNGDEDGVGYIGEWHLGERGVEGLFTFNP